MTRYLFRLALASGSVALVLSLAEVGLRLNSRFGSAASLVGNPLLGWDSSSPEKPVGVERKGDSILFLGDSFTQNNRWPDQTARNLGFPGVNAGASGFGTYQQLLKLLHILSRKRPCLVVLQFYGWNDLRDNWAWPALGYNPEMLERPYLSPGGEEFRPDYPWKWMDGFRITSYFGKRSLVKAWQKADRTMRAEGVDAIAARQETLVAGLCADEAWQAFYLPGMQEGAFVRGAWQVTESCFLRIARACAERKIPLLVLALDAPFTVDEDKWRYLHGKQPALERELPLAKLKAFLEEGRIASVFPQAALREWARKTKQIAYEGDAESLIGHLTPGAQEIVAQEVTLAAGRLLGDKGSEVKR